MINVYNKSILTTPVAFTSTATTVPFDTVALNTNNILALNNNLIQEKVAGFYKTECIIGVQNAGASAANVTLTFLADGNAVNGASITTSVGASGYMELHLPWIIQVRNADSGIATAGWQLSGAVNLVSAIANVQRII